MRELTSIAKTKAFAGESFGKMGLAEPEAIYWLLVPFVIALYFLFKRRSARLPSLLPLGSHKSILHKEIRRSRWTFRALFCLTLAGLSLIAFAAARPNRLKSWTKRTSLGIDIVIVLDVSESMEATDHTPNRMVSAKRVIRDFISRRKDDRIGFVNFGGEAVTKSPLTRDYDFLLSQVDDARMRELRQGTAIGMGLANGIGRLRHSESKNKVIILLTDGDSNVGAINPITASLLARQEGIKIYSIGVGKETRVLVPIYAFDVFGKKTQVIAQVPSYINPELLKEISRMTGGKAYMARDSGALERVLQEIDKLEKTKVSILPMQKREERYFIFALTGTLILAAVFGLRETRFRRARWKEPVVPSKAETLPNIRSLTDAVAT